MSAALLADAFAADPFIRWMLGKAPRSTEPLYRALLDVNTDNVVTTPHGVAVWRSRKMSMREELTMLVATLKTIGLFRFLRLLPQFLAIERRHPKEPHTQLVVIGVAAEARGQGIASRLLQSALAIHDADGIATYLETSQERNLPLYERHGFRVRDELTIPNGPKVWFMWRPPQEKGHNHSHVRFALRQREDGHPSPEDLVESR
jgi:ribosomal protein S18 acetylase RimI-like enzyme